MKTVIEMARDQGLPETEVAGVFIVNQDDLGRFTEIVRADERARMATDKSKEAMKLALEALEEAWYHVGTFQPTEKAIDLYDEARTALREALAEQPAQQALDKMAENARELGLDYEPAQQEPVACVQDLDEVKRKHLVYEKGMDWKDPLYTSPPAQRTWVGLSDEEVKAIFDSVPTASCQSYDHWRSLVALAIENKLREKNT